MKIIILGRSNVGKSTLFNRIINKNKAIIYNTKYLTKDINSYYFKWNNKYHLISDTGGIIFNNKKIHNKINKKIFNKINKYNIILLILSKKDGLLNLDKEILNKIKIFKKKIYIIINKVDNNYTLDLYDFYNIGSNKLFFISAINNTGISDLLDKILNKKNIKQCKKKKIKNNINISIIGRQNVGKSTLFNTLLKKNKNITSSIKGTTIDYITKLYNKYNLNFKLYDTPGIIKYKNKKIEYIIFKKIIKLIKKTHICLFLIDINIGFLKTEFYILKILIKYYKFIIIIFNKIDLIKKNIENKILFFNNFLKKNIYSYKNIKKNYISAINKKNIFNILKNIKFLIKKLNYKIKDNDIFLIKNYINNIFIKKKIYIKSIIQIYKYYNLTFIIKYNNVINKKYKKFIINYIIKYINITPIKFIFKKND